MTECVIVDCDGVLFDSVEANKACYTTILAHFGLAPLRNEEIAIVHANTAGTAVHHLLLSRNASLLDEVVAYSRRMDTIPFIRLMRKEPHLDELLAVLLPDVKLALATNRMYSISHVLRIHHLEGAFQLVVSALDVRHPKPHPEPLNRILNHFRIPAEQALFVGDSEVDQQSAQQAAVPFVAYKNPFLEADYHIDNLMEVARLVRGKR